MRAPSLNTFRTGIARRIFIAFACCTLVPIVAIGALAFLEVDRLATQRATDRLASASGGFGMQLLARLAAADDVLRLLTADHSPRFASDMFASVSKASAVRPRLPAPNEEQRGALQRGGPVLMPARGANGAMRVYLLREDRSSGALVAAELDGTRLWGSPEDLPAGSAILVAVRGGAVLYASPSLPGSLVKQLASRLVTSKTRATGSHRAFWQSPDGQWQAYRWDAFLRGAYVSAAWSVIAVERRKALLAGLGAWHVAFPAALLATLLAVLLLVAMQIRRLFSPLENLIGATRRLARGEFDTSVDTSSRDEIGELARSFNSMTASLQDQFATLLTMAEVDRLLLESSHLERVLDALLPRIAKVMGCETVSVLLLDTDSYDKARVYDFCASAPDNLPLRRVRCELGGLQLPTALSCGSAETGSASPQVPQFLEEMTQRGSSRFELWPVRRGADLAGILCLGYPDAHAKPSGGGAHRGREFADRLSVVLANVAHEAELYHQAHFDALTALPNRLLFRDRLAGDLARSRESAGRGALLYIDLDRFKRINDTAGHGAGDELLKIAGERIATCLREGDTVARLGGDEFAVVLHRIDDPQFARTIAERILTAIGRPVPASDREHYVGASIGIALFPEDGATIDELLKNSDIAMYRAKDAGRGKIVFYEPAMHARVQARASLELELNHALRNGLFELYWQPICAARESRLLGIEALLRCGGPLADQSPSVFIPVAEESGLIVEIGRWVLEAAIGQLKTWRAAGFHIPKIAVNVSPRQLRETGFAGSVVECLRRNQVDSASLELEITESAIAEGAAAERSLRELAQAGVSLALDDFGTGYSSIGYLRTLPIHTVKIDRSFIMDVPASRTACQLVEAIIAMCRSLEKHVIAEGVETPEQLAFLEERGCNAIQGFIFAQPEPAERFAVRHFAAADAQSDGPNVRRAGAH